MIYKPSSIFAAVIGFRSVLVDMAKGVAIHFEMANGTKGLACYGSYSTAAIDLSGTSNTHVGLLLGKGQTIKFQSGTGNGSADTWYSGTFTPTFVGALAIMIDGTTLYVPVCSNRP